MLSEHFRMLGHYNGWANARIYDASAALPETAYRERRACAFFGSIHATLNHLLVVDRLWFGRMAGTDSRITSLDQILYDDLAELRAARAAEDARIVAQLAGYEDADLAQERRFRMITKPEEHALPLEVMLSTVFNHQTHHRGQVHAMLKEAGAEPPGLDIVYFVVDGG